jgi:hypothetical protein
MKGGQRKLSRVSVIEMETANALAKAIFEANKEEDEDGERFFEEECLMKLAQIRVLSDRSFRRRPSP